MVTYRRSEVVVLRVVVFLGNVIHGYLRSVMSGRRHETSNNRNTRQFLTRFFSFIKIIFDN